MKVFVVLLTLLGLTYGASIPDKAGSTLNDDLKALVSIIPMKNVTKLVLQYVANDEEAQEFVAYMTGDKFAVVWKAIFAARETKDLMAWMYQQGVPAYKDVNVFADLLGMQHVSPRDAAPSSRGVASFLDELFELVNPQQLIANIKKMVATSPIFKQFYDRVGSDTFHKLVHKIYMMSEMQDELAVLKEQKVNIDKIVSEIAGILGWTEL